MKYYGQNFEDKTILEYFGDFVGTFADIGANDGITLSNTRAVMERGWKGICVEPSPQAFARLKANVKFFKGVYPYNVAIGNKTGEDMLFESTELLGEGDIGLVSTFVRAEIERFSSAVKYLPVTAKVYRWKTFLNRVKYKTFDFISIDCEGMDLDVLKQINLTKTRMVCVEWNGHNKQAFIDACPGFRLIAENGENLIFAR